VKRDKDGRPKPSLSRDAAYENSFKSFYAAADATGLRPQGMRYRAQSHFHDPSVAENFLVNSRIRRFDREFAISLQSFYFGAAALMASLVGHEFIDPSLVVSLPPPIKLGMELGEAIRKRRSRREYSGEPMGLDDLSTVVWSAAGVTARASVSHPKGGQTWIHFRTTPSGGALYPVELYAASISVTELSRGLYRYEPIKHCLVGVGDGQSVDRLLDGFCVYEDQITLSRAGVILLMVARPWRAIRKYGPRGLRHVFMEAGSMSQNVHLSCVALGLGSVDCSSVYDDEVHEVLRADGVYETVIHSVVIGDPTS